MLALLLILLYMGEHKILVLIVYSKTCLKRPLKNRQNKDLNDKRQLNEGRKYCRMLPLELNEGQKSCTMLPLEHSAILLTCIYRLLVLKNNFGVFLRVAILDRFYCIEKFTKYSNKHAQLHSGAQV